MTSHTPATRAGAPSTRRHPCRKARPVRSDEEAIGQREILQPDQPAARPLPRRFWCGRDGGAAVVHAIDIEEENSLRIDLGGNGGGGAVEGKQLPPIAPLPAFA